MKIKAGVFDRIEQSFFLLKDNFISFFLPIFLYNLFSTILILSSLFYLVFLNLDKIKYLANFSSIFYSSEFIITVLSFILLILIYLILYIPFFLGLIKSIKQAENEEKVSALENIKYGFSRLFKSFKTYWYIFAYVALIPAILFIIGGLMFIYSNKLGFDNFLETLSFVVIAFSGILFLVFAIYRGIKTSFSINSALDKDSFTKDNFLHSIDITKDNWWRILGNFLLIGILTSIIIGIVSFIMNMIFTFSMPFDDIENIASLESLFSNFSVISYFFSVLIDSILNNIQTVFILVFSFIFYLRLNREFEFNNKEKSKTLSEEKIEL